eukprot:scaffold50454_cov39-Attheya_sp.AAC.3
MARLARGIPMLAQTTPDPFCTITPHAKQFRFELNQVGGSSLDPGIFRSHRKNDSNNQRFM